MAPREALEQTRYTRTRPSHEWGNLHDRTPPLRPLWHDIAAGVLLLVAIVCVIWP